MSRTSSLFHDHPSGLHDHRTLPCDLRTSASHIDTRVYDNFRVEILKFREALKYFHKLSVENKKGHECQKYNIRFY